MDITDEEGRERVRQYIDSVITNENNIIDKLRKDKIDERTIMLISLNAMGNYIANYMYNIHRKTDTSCEEIYSTMTKQVHRILKELEEKNIAPDVKTVN